MREWAAAVSLALLGGGFCQEGKKQEPPVEVFEDLGYRLVKPPGKESELWQIKKENTYFKDTMELSSRVRSTKMCIYTQSVNPSSGSNFDLDGGFNKYLEDVKGNENYKSVEVKEKDKRKFPATKDNANYVLMEVEDKGGGKMMWETWQFQSQKNQNIFSIHILATPEDWEKDKRWIEVLRAQGFQTLKVKR